MSGQKNFLEQLNEESKKNDIENALSIEKHQTSHQEDISSHKKKSSTDNKDTSVSFANETFQYQKKTRNYPFIILLVLVVISAGVLYYMSLNQGIEMVNMVGITLEEAYIWADNQSLLLVTSESYSSEVAEGKIMAQSIEPGVRLKGNETLNFTVSIGLDPSEPVELPDFDSSWSRNSVVQWLNSNGVEDFNLIEVKSDVEEDFLVEYRTIGVERSSFLRSSQIEFTFSQVDETTTVVMDNFINQSITSFEVWARNESLDYTVTYVYDELYNENQIIEQNIDPSDEITIDTVIELVVSLGPVDEELVTIPSFAGWDLKTIDAWCQENQIEYQVQYVYNDLYQEEQVVSQSVLAGEEVNTNTMVNVIISLGEGLMVDDFSKSSQNEFEKFAMDYDGEVVMELKYNSEIARGEFIEQSINANTLVHLDNVLYITYSMGSDIKVPDMRMANSVDLIDWANEENEFGANLQVKVHEDNTLQGSYGTIFEQSVYSDYVGLDEVIDVTISVGIRVEDFSEMTKEEASYFSQTATYPIHIEEEYKQGTDEGDFLSQSVTEGSDVISTTYVTLTYSLGNEIRLDDYVGKSLADIQQYVDDVNDLGAHVQLYINEVFNEDVTDGYIISQSPSNIVTHTNELIEVLVSKGEKYTVENFYSMTRDQIEYFAEEDGLNVVFYTVKSDTIAHDRVVSMEPEAGTDISKNDIIYIQIAE